MGGKTERALARWAARWPAPGEPGHAPPSGENRGTWNALGTDEDWQAVLAWVEDVTGSAATRENYLTDARRFLLWARVRCGKGLRDLTRKDVAAFFEFLENLDQEPDWCGPPAPLWRDGRLNPRWRPFRGPLRPSSRDRFRLTLQSLFKYLVASGYLAVSPMPVRRRKRAMGDTPVQRPVERALRLEDWRLLVGCAERLAVERRGWRHAGVVMAYLLRFTFWTGARVGEIVRGRMGDIRQAPDDPSRWLWHVVGKGGKEAEVDVPLPALEALAQFRERMGWPALPAPGEDRPLAPQPGGKPYSKSGLQRMFARLREFAAAQAQDERQYQRLRAASFHWLRHGTATHGAQVVQTMEDLLALQRHMRHEALSTTLRYVHLRDEARRALVDRMAGQAAEGARRNRR